MTFSSATQRKLAQSIVASVASSTCGASGYVSRACRVSVCMCWHAQQMTAQVEPKVEEQNATLTLDDDYGAEWAEEGISLAAFQ